MNPTNDSQDLNAPVCCLACRQETTVGAQYFTHLEFWCGAGAAVPAGANVKKSAFIPPNQIVVIARCSRPDPMRGIVSPPPIRMRRW